MTFFCECEQKRGKISKTIEIKERLSMAKKDDMEFDGLLDLTKKDWDKMRVEIHARVSQERERVSDIINEIISIAEMDSSCVDDGKVERIMGKLIYLMEAVLRYPREYIHERSDVYNNSFLQAVFMTYNGSDDITPWITYRKFVESLAKKIGLPKVKDDPAQIKNIIREIRPKDISLVIRDRHFRIKASQGGGLGPMHHKTGRRCSREDDRPQIPVYQHAYMEMVTIFKGIILSEREDIVERDFWKGVKAWGRKRIGMLVDLTLAPVLEHYRELKTKEDKNLDEKEAVGWLDRFLSDMAGVHEQYGELILSGKQKKRSIKNNDLYNDKFYLYLQLMYTYVGCYSLPEYSYLARYNLEQIYMANTITEILTKEVIAPVHREFIPTEKYPDHLEDEMDSADRRPIWEDIRGSDSMRKEREEREAINHKNMFYIHRIGLYAYICIICWEKLIENSGYKECYYKNLLRCVNRILDLRFSCWGMLPTDTNKNIKIDFYLWFLYRMVVQSPQLLRDTDGFFKCLGHGERILCFLYDWRNGQDEREIEKMATQAKRSDPVNDQEDLINVIGQICKRSNLDQKDIRAYKDAIRSGEKTLDLILSEIKEKRVACKEENFKKAVEALKGHKLIDDQNVIDSIIEQIYKGPNFNKRLEKVCDKYIEGVLEDGPDETNKKMKIKTKRPPKLMRDLYYQVYMDSDDIGTRAVLKKYGLSFVTPLIQEEHIQSFIKDIFQKKKIDDHALQSYLIYLRKAAWLSEDTVNVIKNCKTYNTFL